MFMLICDRGKLIRKPNLKIEEQSDFLTSVAILCTQFDVGISDLTGP